MLQLITLGQLPNEYWNITSFGNGTIYFIIVASNIQSNTSSNCISVTVQDPPWAFDNLASDGADPDPDGDFQLTWDASTGD